MTSSLEGEGGGLDTPQKWWRHLVMTWWQGGGGVWIPPKSDEVIYEQPLMVEMMILANLWHHWAHRIVNKHAFDGVESPIVPHLQWDLQTNLKILQYAFCTMQTSFSNAVSLYQTYDSLFISDKIERHLLELFLSARHLLQRAESVLVSTLKKSLYWYPAIHLQEED